MNFKKFTQLSKLLHLLKGRIVGGAARNFLLNIQKNKEIDIATPYHPKVAYNIVKATGINVIPLKLDHGTFLATYKKEKYEITTLRQDIASIKNRWAKVLFTASWRKDAYRRDFTINALSIKKLNPVKVIDYVNGILDIKARILRFVGNPEERIIEDYLRILRLFRFWARCFQPDQSALDAAIKYKKGLIHISKERIIQEVYLICMEKGCFKPLEFIYQYNIYPINKPEKSLLQLSPLSRLALIIDLQDMPVLKKWKQWQKQLQIIPNTFEEIMQILHIYGKVLALDYSIFYLPKYTPIIQNITDIPKIPIKPTDLPIKPGILMGIHYKCLVNWWQKQYPYPSFEDCKNWYNNEYLNEC